MFWSRKPKPTIIKPGVLIKDRSYMWTCKECGCIFRFKGSDARIGRSSYSGQLLVSVRCPQCNESMCADPDSGLET